MPCSTFRARLPRRRRGGAAGGLPGAVLGRRPRRDPSSRPPLTAGRIVSLHVIAILAGFGLFVVAFGCAAL